MSAAGVSDTDTETLDIGDSVEGTDFGGVPGTGVTFKPEKVTLFGDAWWTYGFTKIDKEGEDIKNNVFSFTAGLGFPLASSTNKGP